MSPRWIFAFPLLWLLQGGIQAADLPFALTTDVPVEKGIAPGQTHVYQVRVAKSQFLRVEVDQEGIDLAIQAIDSAGASVTEVNNPGGWRIPDVLSFLPAADETYRLEVGAAPGESVPGRYRIFIVEARDARPSDPLRIDTERAEAGADRLFDRGTGETYRQALAGYQRVLAGWRELGDEPKQGEILFRLGMVQRLLGESRAALDLLGQALAIEQRTGDRSWQASVLNQRGLAHLRRDEYGEALADFEAARELRKALGQPALEAPILNNIGLLHQSQGRLRQAAASYGQAQEILHGLADRRRETIALNNLASVSISLGEPLAALDYAGRALALSRAAKDLAAEAEALNNLGVVHHRTGEMQQALEDYSSTLDLFRRTGDREKQAAALGNLGSLYFELGELGRALALYDQSAQIQRDLASRRGLAETLGNQGRIEESLGHPDEALQRFQQALGLQREIGDRAGEAGTLLNLGLHYDSAGEPRKALELLSQAQEIYTALGQRTGEARARLRLGSIQAALGDTPAARASFSEALRLLRDLHEHAGEAAALQELARLELRQGDPRAALDRLQPALDLVESLRGQVAGDRLRTSYFASWRDAYELTIETLMELHRRQPGAGYDVQAFETSERARARGLLDLLREGRVEIRSGADPQLLARERELRIRINAKSAREIRLQEAKAPQDQLDETRQEIESLLAEYGLLDGRIRAASPHYADLTRPAGVKLQDVQRHLLDEETLLLEISPGEAKSYLWTLTPSSFASFELPGRPAIEAAAKRAYLSLSAPAPRDGTERRAALADLSRMLLGPVADGLAGRRLAVVAGGALQYIPFAALPSPGAQSGEPLVETHEVVVLPSVSVLGELRRTASGRKPGSLILAVLADPVFGKDDPRLAASRSRTPDAPSPAADLLRSAEEAGASGFERLSWTRREAEGILAQAAGKPVLKALDFEASRETATGPALANARVVHFATHGLLNNESPELSGLVLSLVDREGRPQDGFLRLHDVYNLSLNADLVVLSGCRTALGKEIRGEGLLGLTRGFLYAGSSRVMASLWPVRDRATAELMQRFYRALLREGQPPAAALRAAQRSLRREPRWRDPYYWAPFVVQGDWRSSLP